jgi:hypothetical protein
MWGMDWIDLAHDRDRWLALVNAVMDFRVPENAGYFLSENPLSFQEDSARWINQVQNVCTVLRNMACIYVTNVMSVLLRMYVFLCV